MPLSEEQHLMRQSCRDFVDDVVIPFIRGNWQREWLMTPEDRLPPEILEGADKIGIRTLGVPEEFGGIELDKATEVQTFALIAEEIARGDSGLADKLVQNWKVSVLLRNLAPRHLQESWFPRLVEDPQFLLAHCLTEPRGASDRWLPYNVPEAAMQTRAVKDGDEWVINGRKQFISNGYDAGLYVVYANTNPEGRHAAGHVELPGAARHARPDRRALQRDAGLPLHEQRRAGVRGHARAGGSSAGRERCARQGRRLFPARQDHPGGEEPRRRRARLRGHLGLRAELRAGRAHPDQAPGGGAAARRHGDPASRRCARCSAAPPQAVDDNAPDADTLCNMAKVFASEEILKVAQHAMELHGGNGMMLDFGVEKLFRDAAIFLHMDATADISKFKIVKSMFPDTAGKYAGPE